MYVKFGDTAASWKDYTLVVPSVSVGNTAQLAVDVLIHSLSMDKVGGFHDDSLVAVVGNDPFFDGDSSRSCRLMTAAEVFEKKDKKLVVVQLRSALAKGKKKQFVNKLHEWISTNGFKQVIILTSSFAHERTDSQLIGTQERYITSPEFQRLDTAKQMGEELGWIALEKREAHPAFRDVQNTEQNSGENEATAAEFKDIFIPGGGFAKNLLQKCAEKNTPAVVLLRFCAEGDNLPDAIELASYLNSWTKWVPTQDASVTKGLVRGWKIPPSWKLLYGRGFHQLLFQ